MVLWESMKTPCFERDTEEGAWRLMRVSPTIDNRTRAANRVRTDEGSTCANRND